MNILLTHPGTQYSYALAKQLHRLGLLHGFATGIAFGQDAWGWLSGRLKRRRVEGIPDSLIHRQWWPELYALLHMRQGFIPQDVLLRRNAWFQKKITGSLLKSADVIIGFDTSSWLLMEKAHALGKPFVLDASIAHPLEKEAIYRELRIEFPDWSEQLEPKPPQLIAIEQTEMMNADHIVAATSFTRHTYIKNGIDPAKISVNPYGLDLSFFTSKWVNQLPPLGGREGMQLSFAFLGIISARKGIPWLCRVWKRFHQAYPNTRLLLGGYGAFPPGFQLPDGVEWQGFIEPNDRLRFLHQADVFVFPSYFEGFAQVVIEAMAAGLPVITTTHTVGPEVIDNGVEGFVTEPGQDETLLNALCFFAEHPESIPAMGIAAANRVANMTWDAYGERWKGILQDIISK